MKIKVCGMKYPDNISEVSALQPDFMGFIFYEKSPRYVEKLLTRDILDTLRPTTEPVAVFVNTSRDAIMAAIETYGFKIIQLHGDESPAFCKDIHRMGVQIIKAFRISVLFDFADINAYEAVDYVLFDTDTAVYGGSGKKFPWEVLGAYENFRPYFLSGGIGAHDAEDIRALPVAPYAVDLNSKFESSPGFKDATLVAQMIKNIRHEVHG